MKTGNYKDNLIEDNSTEGNYYSSHKLQVKSFSKIDTEDIIADYFPDFIFVINSAGDIISGYNYDSASSFLNIGDSGKNIFSMFPPEIAEQIISCISESLRSRKISNLEYSLPVNYVNRIYQAQIIPSSQDVVTFIGKDTTEIKRAEEAVFQSELRFRSVWENSIDGMCLIDINGNIVAANKAYSQLVGLSSDKYLGKPFTSVFNDVTIKVAAKAINDFRNNFSSRSIKPFYEMEAGFISGKNLFMEVFTVFIESPQIQALESEVLLLSIFRDITERKKSEQVLKESEEKYRSLIDTSPDPIVHLGTKGEILLVNKRFCDAFLVDPDVMVTGKTLFNFTAPSDLKRLMRDFHNILKAKKALNAEYNFVRSDNNFFPAEINTSLIPGNNGNTATVVAIIRDVTMRKLSEKALRNSELQFRSVWENSTDGMRLTDSEGRIVAVNNSFCTLTGMSESELSGQFYTKVYKGKSAEQISESLEKYRKNFRERKFSSLRQSHSQFLTGKVVDLEVTYSLIEYKEGDPLLLGIFHDVTERIRAEEELRKSEKLAAIGKMAAYVSHEIKTPLASIRMNIDMITRDTQITRENQKSLNIIQKEIKRLNKLLRNVLQYSRNNELLVVNINAWDLVNSIKEFIGTQLEERRIKFINNIKDLRILGDYQKLHSVFLHLIENSIEAIESNGEIEIYAGQDNENDAVVIFIKDSGCGIHNADNIFEPFVTTKNTGTGLGLAISNKIIEQHNGVLKLHSSKAGETIFSITLYNYGI